MFDEATKLAAAEIARRINISPAALLACAEVESGGRAFIAVGGRMEPLIRFEGHYFDRRLTAAQRKKARAAGLSSPTAGAIKNPSTQAARWTLLNKAAAINRAAAYESTSWGMGQVMGAHWAWLGFGSVDELVTLCRRDASGQIDLMARYIDKAGLAVAIRKEDWAAFARGYNGSGYQSGKYDTRIAAAYAKWRRVDLSKAPLAPQDAVATAKPADAPKPVAAPELPPKAEPAPAATAGGNPNLLTAIITAAAVAVGAAWSWLAGLPCEYLNLFCGG